MKQLLKYLLIGIVLFPYLFLLLLSLGQGWVFPKIFPDSWTLDNWQNVLSTQSALAESLGISILIAVTIAATATLLGFITSRSIAYHAQRSRWLLLAYFPYIFSPVIYAACLQFYFVWLGLSGAIAGVLLAQFFIVYPFAVIFFVSFWNEELRAMEQLVLTLGGSRRQAFWRVLLPVAKNPLFICFFQTFLISWFEYGLTMLIGVGKVQTLTVKVFQFVNEANIFNAALASVLLVVPPTLFLIINKRLVFR